MQYIQPFDLLGVTFKSSLSEVRKSYYRLAMMCHPDKGGSPDDMITLHTAFKWIEEQLTSVADREHQDYEEAQSSFDEFVKQNDGVKVLPSVMDISLAASGYSEEDIATWFNIHAPRNMQIQEDNVASAYSWFLQMVMRDIYLASLEEKEVTFDEVCEAVLNNMRNSWETLQPASIVDGYGAYMSTNNDINDSNETEKSVKSLGRKEVVLYKEQDAFQRGALGTSIRTPNTLDNYSITDGKIHGCDYRDAYSDDYENKTFEQSVKTLVHDYDEPMPNVEDRLTELEIERKLLDVSLDGVVRKVGFGFQPH